MMHRKTTKEYRLVDFHEKKVLLGLKGFEVGWYEGVLGLAIANVCMCLFVSRKVFYVYMGGGVLGHLGEVKCDGVEEK